MKILFIVPYPLGAAPSQRFRFEQYFPILEKVGFKYVAKPFWNTVAWELLYKKGHFISKAFYLLTGFAHRFLTLFTLHQYHFIFIHREATPVGPPWFEWWCSRILNKKMVYDFDDAIWLKNTSDANRMISWLKYHRKVASICRWSWKVSCGNDYLAHFASQFNHQVVINPTTIDTKYHVPNAQKKSELTIGWTGTHSTSKYLDLILPTITALRKKHHFRFLVISNLMPDAQCEGMQFLPWNKNEEIEQLAQFDIGVMPLENSEWEKGKCGFKALQYMAMGIPAVVSPAGINPQIIVDGKNGYLCHENQEWFDKLDRLLEDENLRHYLGKNGRKTVIDQYSVDSNLKNFFSLFA